MTTEYAIKVDEETLNELKRRMEIWGGNTDVVMARAINSTANKTRSSTTLPGGGASQRMRKLYGIAALSRSEKKTPVKYINDNLKVFGANRNRLTGKVYSPKRSALLAHFDAGGGTGSPLVNVRKDTGPQRVGNIPQTRKDIAPFYTLAKPDSSGNRQLLIIGIRSTPGPRGGRTRAARTMGVSQMFSWMKEDMMPQVQKEYTDQIISKMRGLLTKLQVPMEDPGDE